WQGGSAPQVGRAVHAGLRGARGASVRRVGDACRSRSHRRLGQCEAGAATLLSLHRGRRGADLRGHRLRLPLRLRIRRGVDGHEGRGRPARRPVARRRAAQGPGRDPGARGDALGNRCPEGRSARGLCAPVPDNGLACPLAVPVRSRTARCCLLPARCSRGGRRSRAARRPRVRARHRLRGRQLLGCCSARHRTSAGCRHRPHERVARPPCGDPADVTEIRIGCSGWNYAHWGERVYPKGLPPKRWLEYYAQLFDTVELNTTFYRLPHGASVEGWGAHTPPGFLFAVTASRYLTHIRRLTDLGGGIHRFYERIAPLRRSPKLGPVLWQLPPTFKRNDERLASALAALPEGRHWFGFREPSWYVDEVYALPRARRVALVIPDSPKYPFRALQLTADWTFVRFHNGRRGRRGNYSESELEE